MVVPGIGGDQHRFCFDFYQHGGNPMTVRRVQVPLVKVRSIPPPTGVQDDATYRCLSALRENVMFMLSEMNPKGERLIADSKGFDESALLRKVQEMIDAAIQQVDARGETFIGLAGGGGGSSDDEKVKTDSGAASAGYLGTDGTDGVLQTGDGIVMTNAAGVSTIAADFGTTSTTVASGDRGLPSTSGKSQYMVLSLGASPGLAPGWDWVRIHS